MDRRSERRFVAEVQGSYQSAGAKSRNTYVSQISANGCRFNDQDGDLKVGDLIQISIGPVGPFDATVRWADDDMAGIEFHETLDMAIVELFVAYCPFAA